MDIQDRQFLTFKLADEQYGLAVLQVREVLEIPRITKVPRMPNFMKGVINIRGSVVPVIDLRLKLGLAEVERSVHSRVVIIEIKTGLDEIIVGILVDSVQEVVEIIQTNIVPAPQIGTTIESAFISGIATVEQGFIIIVNIDHVFDNQEMIKIAGSAESTAVLATEN